VSKLPVTKTLECRCYFLYLVADILNSSLAHLVWDSYHNIWSPVFKIKKLLCWIYNQSYLFQQSALSSPVISKCFFNIKNVK